MQDNEGACLNQFVNGGDICQYGNGNWYNVFPATQTAVFLGSWQVPFESGIPGYSGSPICQVGPGDNGCSTFGNSTAIWNIVYVGSYTAVAPGFVFDGSKECNAYPNPTNPPCLHRSVKSTRFGCGYFVQVSLLSQAIGVVKLASKAHWLTVNYNCRLSDHCRGTWNISVFMDPVTASVIATKQVGPLLFI